MDSNELITKADLESFKQELFSFLEDKFSQISTDKPTQITNKWVKSKEVKQILKISSGTLQTLRIRGIVPFKKIMGTLYYDIDCIDKLLKQDLEDLEQ